MARSLWKGPFIDTFLIRNLKQTNQDNLTNSLNISPKKKSSGETKHSQKIWSRRSVVLPQFIDSAFEVYNGKQFIKLKITEDMIGHKFGEFAITRKKPKHPTLRKNITTKKK
jgi:small subunit ribosomal protein S19